MRENLYKVNGPKTDTSSSASTSPSTINMQLLHLYFRARMHVLFIIKVKIPFFLEWSGI